MKALLVTIPPLEPYYPPPILGILAGCCNQQQVDYEILDLNLYMYDTFTVDDVIQLSNDLISYQLSSIDSKNQFDIINQHLVEKINQCKPDLISISVFSYQQNFVAELLLDYIKLFCPKTKILIGGSGVLSPYKDAVNFGQYCLDKNIIDFCIYGDGEIAFMEILKGNYNYPGINNTNYKQILDLDSLPPLDYSKLDPKVYHYPFEPGFVLTGSRGCVRDCSFCNVKDIWNKFVYKSGSKIAHEVFELYQNTGIANVNFTDSLINGSIKTFREYNKTLIQLKEKNPDFNPKYKGQFICRPVGQLKESDYLEMSLAGVETLVVGIESFSNSVRDHMRKKFDNEAIDYHLLLCSKYGIKNVFLLLTGYVTETLEDHKENLRYLKKYQVYALSNIISNLGFNVGGLVITPDSGIPLNNMETDLGIIYHNVDKNLQDWTCLTNPTLTIKERYRRGAEILLYATQLGYKVMYMNATLDNLERFYKFGKSKEFNPNKKLAIFPN
jgi:radical SAM superfamily enzyme YgiQ (UPF0313 family)